MALTDNLINVMAITLQGDIAGFTFYTSKRRQIVFYPVAPPLDPPSPLQIHQRTRFAALANQWTNWEPADKKNYEDACNEVHATFNGFNLYMQAGLTQVYENLLAVERTTGRTLKRPWV